LDYLVNHSTATYLMNPEGRFAKVLPFGIAPDEIALQISGHAVGRLMGLDFLKVACAMLQRTRGRSGHALHPV